MREQRVEAHLGIHLAGRSDRAQRLHDRLAAHEDVAVEVGAIADARVIRVLRALERFIYRRADAVTVLSDDLRDNVEEKLAGRRGTEVRVIPNFVERQIEPVLPRIIDRCC